MLRLIRIQLKRLLYIFPRVVGWYARTLFMMMGTGRVRREPEYYENFQEDVASKWEAIKRDDELIKRLG